MQQMQTLQLWVRRGFGTFDSNLRNALSRHSNDLDQRFMKKETHAWGKFNGHRSTSCLFMLYESFRAEVRRIVKYGNHATLLVSCPGDNSVWAIFDTFRILSTIMRKRR